MLDRRKFMIGTGAALTQLAAGRLAAAAVAGGADWKTAFRSLGFDPEAPGCGVFAVIGDPHVDTSPQEPIRAEIAFWNAMRPRPAAVISVGDQLCRISRQFGDREWPADPRWRAAGDAECARWKALIDTCEVPLKHVIGNHDTFPDEPDGQFYGSHFPGWKPYERIDAAGAQIILLNTGHDGWIDPKQEAWLVEEKRRLDPGRALILVGHQPSMHVFCEYGIPCTIRRVFGDWNGEFWYLGGHNHINHLKKFRLPNGNCIGVATHARAPVGHWLYGVKNGSVAARLFIKCTGFPEDRPFSLPKDLPFRGFDAPSVRPMPGAIADAGPMEIPFEYAKGVIWKTLVGEGDEKRLYRVEFWPHSDAGHWYCYAGRTVYRLPLREKAPGATHAAFLGRLFKNRKTQEQERVFLSGDGKKWSECALPRPSHWVYSFPIPESMRKGEYVYLRIDGHRCEGNTYISGFALMSV